MCSNLLNKCRITIFEKILLTKCHKFQRGAFEPIIRYDYSAMFCECLSKIFILFELRPNLFATWQNLLRLWNKSACFRVFPRLAFPFPFEEVLAKSDVIARRISRLSHGFPLTSVTNFRSSETKGKPATLMFNPKQMVRSQFLELICYAMVWGERKRNNFGKFTDARIYILPALPSVAFHCCCAQRIPRSLMN